MNHRVSIVVSSTSNVNDWKWTRIARSLLESQLPLKISLFKRICALHFSFYTVEPCAEFTCYSPLVLCHSHVVTFFLGSTLNSGPHARTKHSTQSGVFVHFFLLFFYFFANLPFTTERYTVVCVSRASSCWWKKSDSPTSCVSRSSQYPLGERMFEEGESTNRIIHVRFLCTVDLCFRSFSIKPEESTRSSSTGFSFSAFFASPLKQKWHKSVIRNDTKSVTSKLGHVYLLFDCRWSPTACQSLTSLEDSSTLSMLTKTYLISQQGMRATKVKNGENCDRTYPSTLQFPRWPAVLPGPFHEG